MDCIYNKSSEQTASLLTQADKITRLETLFSKYRHKNDIFLPDDNFYQDITGPEDIDRMATAIFKWLGIKHRSISFHIEPDQDQLVIYRKQGSSTIITLGWKVQGNAILGGATLAHVIAHHLLISRSKLDLGSASDNEEMADLGTIHAGLAILVMNGLGDKTNVLGTMARANYIAECIDYFNERSIVQNIWQPYVYPQVVSSFVTKQLPQDQYVSYVHLDMMKHKQRIRQLVMSSLIALFIVTGLAFAYLSQPKYLSAEMKERLDTAKILKSQYERCQKTVRYKQQAWDKEDIFMQRQIDADQTRCTSLKNRYNYEVSQYNSRL